MENKFIPEAKKRWDAILPEHRTILQQNVWCPKCQETTTMINISGTVEGNTLILRGNCIICLHNVARVLEENQ